MIAKQPEPAWPRPAARAAWSAGAIALVALQLALAGVAILAIGAVCFAVLRAIAA